MHLGDSVGVGQDAGEPGHFAFPTAGQKGQILEAL